MLELFENVAGSVFMKDSVTVDYIQLPFMSFGDPPVTLRLLPPWGSDAALTPPLVCEAPQDLFFLLCLRAILPNDSIAMFYILYRLTFQIQIKILLCNKVLGTLLQVAKRYNTCNTR